MDKNVDQDFADTVYLFNILANKWVVKKNYASNPTECYLWRDSDKSVFICSGSSYNDTNDNHNHYNDNDNSNHNHNECTRQVLYHITVSPAQKKFF